MSFQGPNDVRGSGDPGISDPRDRASLQPPSSTEPLSIRRDSKMDWKPDLVNDATEWIQRAVMGDEQAAKEVALTVAPALLTEVKRLRRAASQSG